MSNDDFILDLRRRTILDLRVCSTNTGRTCLMVKYFSFNGGVDHYRVKKDGRGMSVDDMTFFSNLIELIDVSYVISMTFLIQNLSSPKFLLMILINTSITILQHYSADKDGLVCELRRPVEKEGQKEFCVDQKAFAECMYYIL